MHFLPVVALSAVALGAATFSSQLVVAQTTGNTAQPTKGAPAGAPFVAFVPTLKGDTIRIGQGARTTLVAVFATWCRPCRDEVPALNMLQRDFASRGVQVVALSMDEGTNAHLSDWLKHYGAEYPVTRDSIGLARKLGVTSVPAVYLVDSSGRVTWSLHGALLSELPELRARLRALPPLR